MTDTHRSAAEPVEGASRLRVPQARRPALAAGALALVLGLIWLAGPRTGTHLATQLFAADFARHHPLTPVDLRWFSGVQVFRTDLWPPVVLAFVGARVSGVLAAAIVSAQVAELFRRTAARRPLVGGLLAAVLQVLDLVAGQVSFTLALVFALGALLALSGGKGGVPAALVAGFLCGAASPAATVFLWVCCLACAARGNVVRALVPLVASAVPYVGTQLLYGAQGARAIGGGTARDALIATAIVLIVVPVRPVALRVGAGLAFVLVLVTYFYKTPLGDDAALLSLLFAVPVAAAWTTLGPSTYRPWVATLATVLTALPQQLGQFDVVHYSAGRNADYYTAVLDRLDARGPLTGRVEVPDTRAHWDTAYLARSVLLARGGDRALDRSRNRRVFFTGSALPAAAYYRYLIENSVQYVAVPDLELSDVGERERTLIRSRPDFLTPVWSDAHWQLFTVRGAEPVVRSPGRATALSSTEVALRAPARRLFTVQVRWSRSLTLSTEDGDACIRESPGGYVQLRTAAGGGYRIGSTLTGAHHHC